ncbi:MAG: hypothetical protein ACFHXK_07945 [bacterium]
MQNHRLAISLGIALALHAAALWWWIGVPEVAEHNPASTIDLVLLQDLRATQMPQPAQVAEEVGPPVSQPDPSVPHVAPDVGSANPASAEPDTTRRIKPRKLDLSRPDNWADSAPAPGSVENHVRAFRGEFYQRLEQRQAAQGRRQLLAGRRIAQRGLPADQYNALERPGSGHYKTAAGCFDLKADIAGSIGADQRAWITACKDLITSPFELPALEFDSLGRAIAP